MFKVKFTLVALTVALSCSLSAFSQAPAGAPAGSTGLCKDGTYSKNATKSGACSGHKGVQTWFSAAAAPAPAAAPKAPAAAPAPAPAPAPAAAAAPKAMPAPTPAAAPKSMPAPAAVAAAGGGPGMVWVNTASKVYHCPTDRYYGKTKAGKYVTEAAATAEGDHADAGKKCF